jgi:hypothetical protein
VGGDQDERPPPIGHRLDEPLEFLARQGAWLVVFDLRQLDPARGVRGDLPRLGGSPEDHAEDLHGVLRPPRARSGLHDRVDVGAGDRVQRSSPEVRFDLQAPQLVVGDQAAAGAAPNRTTLGNQQALLGCRVYRGSSGACLSSATSAALRQHADEHRPEDPIVLAVDQQLYPMPPPSQPILRDESGQAELAAFRVRQ